MSNLVDKHTTEEDFPLSGGDEPNFKYGKQALIAMILMIILVALVAAHSKGVF